MRTFWTITLLLSLSSSVTKAQGWGNDELEIFDLVEEVNTIKMNFYEYMEIPKDASTADVRKAYRKLSLILHPDKNDAEDASMRFRWLASIYETLKDPAKREIYDRVLVEGLPNWRSPIYYYRRMRKMGLAEGIAYLFVIVTVCQYFVNWAAYWERKFTLKEALASQTKKSLKKVKKKNIEAAEELMNKHEEGILGPKPTCFDTLPFQMFRGLKYLVFAIPGIPGAIYDVYLEQKKMKEAEELRRKEEEELVQRKEEEKRQRKERAAQRKQVAKYREGFEEEARKTLREEKEKVFQQPANANQVWTDDDLAKLAKLMKKFPGGTPERWEKIADLMERFPHEVTRMAKKVKDYAYQVPVSESAQGVTGLENTKIISDECLENNGTEYCDTNSEEDSDDESTDYEDDNYGVYSVATTAKDYEPVEIKTKRKTKGGKLGLDGEEEEEVTLKDVENWTQQQQKAFELALKQFPKGTSERWDRIAGKVNGKTKEQCMMRFKHLAEIVKKKREETS